MVLGIKGIFPPGRELTVNYNWYDITSGSGYVRFYGLRSTVSGNTTYLLGTSAFKNTGQVTINCSGGGTVWVGLGNMTIDFNSSIFNLPRTINGIVVISIPLGIAPDAPTPAKTVVFSAKLIKVAVDLSETDLTSSVTSGTLSSTEATAETPSMLNTNMIVALPKITNQLIKKGEKIQLQLVFTATNKTYLFLNPSGGSVTVSESDGPVTASHTNLEVDIPFKVDL